MEAEADLAEDILHTAEAAEVLERELLSLQLIKQLVLHQFQLALVVELEQTETELFLEMFMLLVEGMGQITMVTVLIIIKVQM
jgi:hypothetical protein